MGLGSFICIVAEAIACVAVSKIILIDPGAVEEHELNRLLYLSHLYLGSAYSRVVLEENTPSHIRE